MKLALVTETFPPEINGVAMTLSHLAAGLAERGHHVTVHRPRQSPADTADASVGYAQRLHPGLPIPRYRFLRLGLPAGRQLRQAWSRDRPDLVHVATEGPLGYSALRAVESLGLPVSSSFHTNFHAYSRDYGFAWLTPLVLAYLRHFHNRTRVTLAPTVELNAQLTAQGFRGLRLLSRGVNTRLFSPAKRRADLRAQWGAGPDDLVVVHVSRLAAEKNYPLLFRAYAAIRQQQPRARFVVVSDGPLRVALQRQYPWAHFTGFLPNEALAAHYASADLFLYASLTETFGNVVTESMASGLPVLAFNYAAAARYIRDAVNGRVLPVGDADGFVATALTLASDADERRRLGAAARTTAETISWDAVIDRLVVDLHEVAGLPSRPLAAPVSPV